tara:strand:+ start:3275 stop:3892 length:618 start_codon:yes stop_codon:yes gene_type:complete
MNGDFPITYSAEVDRTDTPHGNIDELIMMSEVENLMKNDSIKAMKEPDSFLGMLLELLKGRWTEREEQTGQSMGIQNVAALSALEFLKPPQATVPTKNPNLLQMGLKEEINPASLEMIAMGTMGKPKGISKPKTPTPVKFKKAEDFQYSGYWVGTVGGKEHKIWRETQTGFDTIQGWWYDEAGNFLGMTKKEAIEKLQSMASGKD